MRRPPWRDPARATVWRTALFAIFAGAAFAPFLAQSAPAWTFATPEIDRPLEKDGQPVYWRDRVAAAAPGGIVHAPTLAQLPDGTLLAAWYAGSDEARSDVAVYGARLLPGAA